MQLAAHTQAHAMRARRTAALARGCLAGAGLGVSLLDSAFAVHRTLSCAGFALLLLSAVAALVRPDWEWLTFEGSLALPSVLIVGLGGERVTVLTLLWLAAVATGVLVRGGRVHWVGRTVLICSVALPVGLAQHLPLAYAALTVGVLTLLVTCGRISYELYALLAHARYEGDHDELTGLLSRTAFRQHLDAQASAPDRERTLLFVDLDGFGQINKTNGHAAGDAALTHVGELLSHRSGPGAVVGRLGGDEFGVLVPGTDGESLAGEVVNLLQAGDVPVTASIGVASSPRDGRTADSLLRASDIALRIAKRAGRGKVSIYAGNSLSDEGPDGARAALERMIAGENLAIVVQPIVDTSSGVPHAYEALARFNAGSTSSPLHWFALADEFGMRPELELACLREALDLLEQLPGESRLSVNLSGSLLDDPRTLQLLTRPTSLGQLIIELTENTLVEDTPQLRNAIVALNDLGAHLAIDDMGAGYSGLRQITSVHARYLKLDRSLVTGIESNPGRQALIAALQGYAAQTNGALVAEGIETEAELQTIRRLGVPLVQGYLLGRPGPPWPLTGEAASARVRARERP